MRKHLRRRVIAWETEPNPHDTDGRNSLIYTAVLECGHRLCQGIDGSRPMVKACWQCGRLEPRTEATR